MPENNVLFKQTGLAEELDALEVVGLSAGLVASPLFADGSLLPTPRLRRQHARIYAADRLPQNE